MEIATLNAFFAALKLDATFTGMFGLNPASTNDQFGAKWVKGPESWDLILDQKKRNLPRMFFYVHPSNANVSFPAESVLKVCLSFFGDNPNQVGLMAERAEQILDTSLDPSKPPLAIQGYSSGPTTYAQGGQLPTHDVGIAWHRVYFNQTIIRL